MFPISLQCVCTTARRTHTETCGTQFWARSWNASCALVPMASRTANGSRAPVSTRANNLWSRRESAARLVQVRGFNWFFKKYFCEWFSQGDIFLEDTLLILYRNVEEWQKSTLIWCMTCTRAVQSKWQMGWVKSWGYKRHCVWASSQMPPNRQRCDTVASSAQRHFHFFFPEPQSKSNHTQCQLGSKNNVTVYKVRSSLRVDPSDTVRIIAVEKQRTAEVEVQAWKTVEGNVTTGDAQFLLSWC